jgi:dihydrofolate reductase
MRTLAITQNVTLDGSIEMLGDWFDPQGGPEDTSDLHAELTRQQRGADAVLLGRQTFEDMRGYWPGQTDDTTRVPDLGGICPKRRSGRESSQHPRRFPPRSTNARSRAAYPPARGGLPVSEFGFARPELRNPRSWSPNG